MTPPATPPGAPDPALADPMLRVVREQHPEVDIVVLPQTRPAPAVPVLDAERRTTLAADAEHALDDLLQRLQHDPHATERDASWHTDEWGLSWYEAVAVVGDLGEGDNVALLRSTGRALLDLGWQARPVPGDRPRLVARRRGGLEAAGTVRPTSVVLTVRTAKVRAAEEVAR